MAVKTITITEKAYNKLLNLKKERESFSDLFNRISDEKKGKLWRDHIGILKNNTETIFKTRERYKKIRKDLSESFEIRKNKINRQLKELN